MKLLKCFTNEALILGDHSWSESQLLTHLFSIDLPAVARLLENCLFDPYAPVPQQRHARHSRNFFMCFVLAPALLQKYPSCYVDYGVQ